jgi:cell division protein FtsZ
MSAKGMAIMGTGRAKGENRAVEAATAAISSPLLENISIDGATGIIINVTGGPDLSLYEVNEASTLITEAAHEDAEIIFGAVIDEEMGDEVRVTVIATGFGLDPATQQATQNQQTMAALAQQMRSTQAMNAMPSFQQGHVQGQAHADFGGAQFAPPPPPPQFAQPQYAQQPASFAQPSAPYIPPVPQAPHFTQMQQPMNQQFAAEPTPEVLHQPMAQPMNQQSAMDPQFAGQPSPYDMNINGSVQADVQNTEKPLPRDVLLAKARQYRESQNLQQNRPQPEQLSMNVQEGQNSLEMARRLANEIVKSPFDTKNLDVPAFLRRKQQAGQVRDEDENSLT